MSRRRACRGIAVLLAAVTAVPVGTVAAAAVPLPPASGRAVEPWPGAARGLRPSWPGDIPGGRILPAASTPLGMPAAGRGLRGDAPGGMDAPVAFTPETAAPVGSGPAGSMPAGSGSNGSGPVGSPHGSTPGRSRPIGSRPVGSGPVEFGASGAGASGPAASGGVRGDRSGVVCDGRGGPYQRQAERWLKLRADGKQSAADCRAVRAFQRKHGVEPATGTAGATTWARMRSLSAGGAPRTLRGCPERSYRIACVDLTHKRTWVQQRGRILFGPVPMRSGGVRHPTRTGWFRIFWRHLHHWSTLYNSPMPYAQFFSGGQAFHAVRGSIRTVGGSMGCVNLRLADARGLWKVLRKGDHVYVWGRRPRG